MQWPSWRWTRRAADLDEEIRGHLEMAARERIERGQATDDAERAARREFGNVGLIKEVTREMWGWAALERLAQDVRYGVRLLRRSPGFTFVAVVSLALGIGANTTIFTVLNAVLVRPLPYPDPDRLTILFRAHEIVGVAPARFRIASLAPAIYLPLPLDPHKPDAVGSRAFMCFGRLKPGASLESARAELTSIASDLSSAYTLDRGFGVSLFRLHDYLVKDSRLILSVLMAVVVSVLLIACANVASLLLTRGIARRQELAIRASLGASRFRIVRQLIVESLLLSSLGGAAGLLFGAWATRALLALSKTALTFGRVDEVTLDSHVLAFTIAASSTTAVLFGLLPAWEASRADVQRALRSSGRGGSADRHYHRLRNALVVGEVSIAVVLLVGG